MTDYKDNDFARKLEEMREESKELTLNNVKALTQRVIDIHEKRSDSMTDLQIDSGSAIMYGICSALSTCSKATALRLAEDFWRYSLIDAIFNIIDNSHHDPFKGHIFYYDALLALSRIFAVLRSDSEVEKDLAAKFMERWYTATLMMWYTRLYTPWPTQYFHYSSFGDICFYMLHADSVQFLRMITESRNFTIPLLVRYWRLAPDPHSRRRLEIVVSRISTPVSAVSSTKGEMDLPLQALRRLFQFIELDFGKIPGRTVTKLLLKGLDAGTGHIAEEGIEKARISTGVALTSLGRELLSPPEAAQTSLIRALSISTNFWRRYFTSLLEEPKQSGESPSVRFERTVEPCLWLLHSASRLEPKYDGRMAFSMIRGRFFDYLERIVIEGGLDDTAHEFIEAILSGIVHVLKNTGPVTRRTMGVELPRTRLLHELLQPYLSIPAIKQLIRSSFLLSSPSFNSFPFSLTIDIRRDTDVHMWVSLLSIQDKTVHYRRCARYGCKKLAKYACKKCATRYCSRGCQRKDWVEHRLLCDILPAIHHLGKLHREADVSKALSYKPKHMK